MCLSCSEHFTHFVPFYTDNKLFNFYLSPLQRIVATGHDVSDTYTEKEAENGRFGKKNFAGTMVSKI